MSWSIWVIHVAKLAMEANHFQQNVWRRDGINQDHPLYKTNNNNKLWVSLFNLFVPFINSALHKCDSKDRMKIQLYCCQQLFLSDLLTGIIFFSLWMNGCFWLLFVSFWLTVRSQAKPQSSWMKSRIYSILDFLHPNTDKNINAMG